MFSWKAVLKGIEAFGVTLVPGGQAVDQAIHAAIESKTGAEKEKAIIDAVIGSLATIEAFKPELIADDKLFEQGVLEAHEGFEKIRASLKPAAKIDVPTGD